MKVITRTVQVHELPDCWEIVDLYYGRTLYRDTAAAALKLIKGQDARRQRNENLSTITYIKWSPVTSRGHVVVEALTGGLNHED